VRHITVRLRPSARRRVRRAGSLRVNAVATLAVAPGAITTVRRQIRLLAPGRHR
jgi:hypothetical protein